MTVSFSGSVSLFITVFIFIVLANIQASGFSGRYRLNFTGKAINTVEKHRLIDLVVFHLTVFVVYFLLK